MFIEYLPLVLFVTICGVLILGYPVALTLAGVSLLFAIVGIISGIFDAHLLQLLPERIYGIMTNETLIAVPLFILMGLVLQRTELAMELLESMQSLFGRLRGGLGISVILVGTLLAASTGIVGASVVAMGLMSLPALLKYKYPPAVASGLICATGTLGQIIPPSIVLVLLGDVISSAYQQSQIKLGVFNLDNVSVGDLFAAAFIPGGILVALYTFYLLWVIFKNPDIGADRTATVNWKQLLTSLLPPVMLIILVLGSIISGQATPTEAAGVGAAGTLLFALLKGRLTASKAYETAKESLKMTAMVFMILIGASVFSLVFRGFGGDELIEKGVQHLGDNTLMAVFLVMLLIFLLGFILDFIEIIFVIIPIVGPIILAMGLDPIVLAMMIAVNLQTSFLTPPFGFSLFYFRSVAPTSIPTTTIYKGVIPFIIIQLLVLFGLSFWL